MGVSTEFQNYSMSSLDFTPWLSDMGKTLRCQVDPDSIPPNDDDDENDQNNLHHDDGLDHLRRLNVSKLNHLSFKDTQVTCFLR